MPRPDPWTSIQGAGEVRLELAPTGFVGFYRFALALVIMFGSLAAPLGLVGVIGGLQWRDFPLALRIVMFTLGGATVGATLWLSLRLVLDATSLRSRVRVLPDGLLVELGHVAPSRSLWLSPRDDVTIELPRRTELTRRGVVLSSGGRTIHVGVGLDDGESSRLLAAIQSALRSLPAGPGAGGPPPLEPLGLPWSARARRLRDDLLRPLRRPTSFLLLDVGAIVGVLLLQWVFTDLADRRAAYPAAFALFLLGLAARRFDGSYVAGLRRHLAESPQWSIYYVLGGAAIGLGGLLGGLFAGLRGPWIFAPLLLSIALHVGMLRRARGTTPPPRSSPALDLALATTLIPLSVLHESAMFEFFARSRDLGPLALAMIVPTVVVAYLPVRMHAFVDAPDDRANVTWFWLTVALLALQPFVTLGRAFTR